MVIHLTFGFSSIFGNDWERWSCPKVGAPVLAHFKVTALYELKLIVENSSFSYEAQQGIFLAKLGGDSISL